MDMEKIIEEITEKIMSLEVGNIFTISSYLSEYSLTNNEKLKIALKIINDLRKNELIKEVNEEETVGLIYNIPFIIINWEREENHEKGII